MKSPPFLMVLPSDVGRVGALGAAILALVRYVTGLPGETSARKTVDGDMWWRASHDDIGEGLGGVHRDSVRRALVKLQGTGELLARTPVDSFYGDRAQAYRVPDLPLRGMQQGSEQPLRETAESITRNAPVTVRGTAQSDAAKSPDVPIPLENLEEHSVGKNARSRGARLPHDWMPAQEVIDAMKAECPHVDLQAEHAKFIDYWTDKTGRDATKVSWDGTWRNWIRRAAESQQRSGPTRNGRSTADLRVQQTQALKRQPAQLELG